MAKVKRRDLIIGTAVGITALATNFPKPALSQGLMEWKMVTSWPKGLPGLGTGAERLAKRISDLSNGRLTIKVYSAGELVPALQCFDAVASGTAEMSHDGSYYHLSKSAGCGFFSAVPFGMTANELNAWVYFGGGQELWDNLYDGFGLKGFLAGNTGVQMGGWFKKEIKSVNDLKGLKFRMPGQGGQALTKLGVTVVNVAGGEIFANLQSGAIDGAEWVGPYNDLSLGFYKVATNYYWPGFHEPGTGLQCMINKSKLSSLPQDLQEIIDICCKAENDYMLAEFNAQSATSLQSLIKDHGVKLRQFPKDVLQAFGNASGEVMQEILDKGDEKSKKIAQSYLAFRDKVKEWTRISEQAYTNARLLDFKYPN
ncbi:MAG: TRAP transporter substrate-binding protein [Alphaproteobacteria bacterium]|nr:TRAP transporter substrate-binding protein [Alphaproteobacteria bacterium]